MSSHERVTPELITVQQLVGVPAVLAAMRSTGLLDRVLADPATTDELATGLGLDAEGVGRLCAALESLGLLDGTDGRWSTTLTPDGIAHAEQLWDSLESVLAGEPRRRRCDDATQAAADYPAVVARIAAMFGAAPDRLAAELPAVDGRILDVGAGAAPWSIAMLRAWPAATATMLDLPGVADVTEQAIAGIGLDDRADVVAGDAWTVGFDQTFDLVVLAGVCHLFAEDRVAALLGRAVQWLTPGGRLVVIDAGASAEPPSVDGAFHDLSLWLRGDGGHRSQATHLRWMIDAGLTAATPIDLDDTRLVAVTATLENSR